MWLFPPLVAFFAAFDWFHLELSTISNSAALLFVKEILYVGTCAYVCLFSYGQSCLPVWSSARPLCRLF